MIKIIRKSTWRNVMDHIRFLKLMLEAQRDQKSFLIDLMEIKYRRLTLEVLWAGRDWE